MFKIRARIFDAGKSRRLRHAASPESHTHPTRSVVFIIFLGETTANRPNRLGSDRFADEVVNLGAGDSDVEKLTGRHRPGQKDAPINIWSVGGCAGNQRLIS